jgi:hypothetical protein
MTARRIGQFLIVIACLNALILQIWALGFLSLDQIRIDAIAGAVIFSGAVGSLFFFAGSEF